MGDGCSPVLIFSNAVPTLIPVRSADVLSRRVCARNQRVHVHHGNQLVAKIVYTSDDLLITKAVILFAAA